MRKADYAHLVAGPVTARRPIQDKEIYARYLASLEDPFSIQGIKTPTGYPIKTTTIAKHNIFNVNVNQSSQGVYTIDVGGTNTNVAVATPIAFGFQPSVTFDAATNLQVSFAGQSPAAYLFTSWSNVMISNGWASNYSSYRIVSAGMKYRYTGAPLYAQGTVSATVTNLSAFTAYAVSPTSNSTSLFYQDPDTQTFDIKAPICMTWTPADIDCLTLKPIGANDISGIVDAD